MIRKFQISAALVAVASLKLMLGGCVEPGRTESPEVVRGRGVYLQHCVSCHGVEGKGVPGAFPALQESLVLRGDPAVLERVIREGPRAVLGDRGNATVMPPFGYLNDEQMRVLIVYLRHRWAPDVVAAQP